MGCDKFINQSTDYPQIENTNLRVMSEETAYQMTSILSGAVKEELLKN